jgi:hypothetical protein
MIFIEKLLVLCDAYMWLESFKSISKLQCVGAPSAGLSPTKSGVITMDCCTVGTSLQSSAGGVIPGLSPNVAGTGMTSFTGQMASLRFSNTQSNPASSFGAFGFRTENIRGQTISPT